MQKRTYLWTENPGCKEFNQLRFRLTSGRVLCGVSYKYCDTGAQPANCAVGLGVPF